jgi:hypothetical protein
MNEAVLWTAGALGSGLIGVILAIIFDEPIRGGLRVVLGKRAKPYPLAGTWRAEFKMADGNGYVEIIRIRKRLGKVEGHIVPHPENYLALRSVEYKKPLRLEGDLSTSDVFSGMWFHPIDTSRYHGTFQLLLHPRGTRLDGLWLGYSDTRREIVSGSWNWTRV